MKCNQGLGLLELLFVLVILGILTSIAVPGYQNGVRTARLAEARAALLENHHFLQRWLLQYGFSPYVRDQQWPELPVSGTVAFEIRISTRVPSFEPSGNGGFLVYATPKVASDWKEPFVLRVDQDGNVRHCLLKSVNEVERCTVL